MYKLFSKFCLNCKDATRLVSEGRERPLTFMEKVKLKILCVMCPFTKRYREQVDAVCDGVANQPDCCEEALPEKTLCEEARARIKKALGGGS